MNKTQFVVASALAAALALPYVSMAQPARRTSSGIRQDFRNSSRRESGNRLKRPSQAAQVVSIRKLQRFAKFLAALSRRDTWQ